MDNGRGENLLASVGLDRFLIGKPKPFSEADVKRAGSIPIAIGRQLKAFCKSATFDGDPAERVEFDLDTVCDAIEAPLKPDDLAARCEGLDVDDVAAVSQAVGTAQAYLATLTPKRATRGLIALEKRKPSLVERLRFARAWDVACDPLCIFEDWNTGRLSRDQVTHAQGMFPALLMFAQTSLLGEFSDTLSKNEDWRLPRSKLRAIETLFQRTNMSQSLYVELQKAYGEADANDPNGTGGSGGGSGKAAKAELTAAQRLELG